MNTKNKYNSKKISDVRICENTNIVNFYTKKMSIYLHMKLKKK